MSVNESTEVSGSAVLVEQQSLSPREYVGQYARRVRSGDIGSLPIIIGLIIIAIIFQSLNQNYLTPRNFVNLIVQMAGLATIAIGVVFVLLMGEIDLSIGYVSGVAGVIMTLMLLPPFSFPWFVAIPITLLLVALIGLVQSSIITSFGLPSFIVTLAGLLVWNGVVLILVGAGGTIIIQDRTVIAIANSFLPGIWGWVFAVVVVALFAFVSIMQVRNRRKVGLSATPMPIVFLQILIVALLVIGGVYVCDQDRGVPFVGVLLTFFLVTFTFVATSTRFGRYIYAVGGNAEAARRAGIAVNRIRIYGFMLSSFMAGCGGIILASRLRSVSTDAGGGALELSAISAAVIGGTSLFGGSGRVVSALLGALVVASVENGMGLLGLSAGIKFVVTGFVLVLAAGGRLALYGAVPASHRLGGAPDLRRAVRVLISEARTAPTVANGGERWLKQAERSLPTDTTFPSWSSPCPRQAPGKIPLRQELGGICGTDLHNWQNHLPEPTFMGHEAVGVIAALGAGVDTDFLGNPIAEGDRIVFHPRNGGVAYGFRTVAAEDPPFSGGFADYIYLADDTNCFVKFDGPAKVGVLAEPRRGRPRRHARQCATGRHGHRAGLGRHRSADARRGQAQRRSAHHRRRRPGGSTGPGVQVGRGCGGGHRRCAGRGRAQGPGVGGDAAGRRRGRGLRVRRLPYLPFPKVWPT
ncbi:MAG: alcohol dehydrogenase catalytic domain-containing protein [Caldilineaceae bacterium]